MIEVAFLSEAEGHGGRVISEQQMVKRGKKRRLFCVICSETRLLVSRGSRRKIYAPGVARSGESNRTNKSESGRRRGDRVGGWENFVARTSSRGGAAARGDRGDS